VRGKVWRWDRGKNHGFIKNWLHRSIFVHRSDVSKNRRLWVGTKVKFRLVSDKGRPKAINVRIIRPRRLSTLEKIFLGSLALTIILIVTRTQFVLDVIDYIIFIGLIVAEISGLLVLLFKLDKIRIKSTLRLWGLRILALIMMVIGAWISFLLLFVSIISLGDFNFLSAILSSPSRFLLGILPFLIPGLGLTMIGIYLEFKFMTRSGIIIHQGLRLR